MKKLVFILIATQLLACKQAGNNELPMNAEMAEETTQDLIESTAIVATDFQFLAQQKLQDYIELISLLADHPEFHDDIKIQLKAITKDSLAISGNEELSIVDFNQLGDAVLVSDSIQHYTFRYTLKNNSGTKTDTLAAYFTTKIIELDDKKVPTTKVILGSNTSVEE